MMINLKKHEKTLKIVKKWRKMDATKNLTAFRPADQFFLNIYIKTKQSKQKFLADLKSIREPYLGTGLKKILKKKSFLSF